MADGRRHVRVSAGRKNPVEAGSLAESPMVDGYPWALASLDAALRLRGPARTQTGPPSARRGSATGGCRGVGVAERNGTSTG